MQIAIAFGCDLPIGGGSLPDQVMNPKSDLAKSDLAKSGEVKARDTQNPKDAVRRGTFFRGHKWAV
jgi:hypothetical protein